MYFGSILRFEKPGDEVFAPTDGLSSNVAFSLFYKEHRLTPKETAKRLKVNLQWYRPEIERKVSDNDVILLLID